MEMSELIAFGYEFNQMFLINEFVIKFIESTFIFSQMYSLINY